MEFMTIKEAAEKWNLSVRRVQTICNEGMIEGAMKFGNTWAIPKNAVKPADKRIKSGKYIISILSGSHFPILSLSALLFASFFF